MSTKTVVRQYGQKLQDRVDQYGMEYCVNETFAGQSGPARPAKPLDEDELKLLPAFEEQGLSPYEIAQIIRDRRSPAAVRAAKNPNPEPAKAQPRQADHRFVSIAYSPKECEVLARGIGMLLASGFTPVGARRLLEKLIAGEARGRLVDKVDKPDDL